MTKTKGFWSYAHADDDAEGGRICALARDLATQYELITGDTIDLFLDRDNLSWGDQWRSTVDGSLASTAFFIPVLTPRYFQSVECRRELNAFARKARNLGLSDLILPVLYIQAPYITEPETSDDAIDLVKTFQWVDWTDLRYASRDSSEYRRAVAEMAQRLAAANTQADKAALSPPLSADENDAQELGSEDILARAEEAISGWADTFNQIEDNVSKVGLIMENGSEEISNPKTSNGGFAGRVLVYRKIAKELQSPADDIAKTVHSYTSQMNDIDAGLIALIPRLDAEVRDGSASREEVSEFFQSIETFAANIDSSFSPLKDIIDASPQLEAMSRDLRKPLKTLRQALTSVYESRTLAQSWVQAIDATEVGSTIPDQNDVATSTLLNKGETCP